MVHAGHHAELADTNVFGRWSLILTKFGVGSVIVCFIVGILFSAGMGVSFELISRSLQ